jgi:large subunit ribosomal protein L23
MTAYDIVKKPIITEKTEILRREFNKYTFEVNKKANKIEIKKAVEAIFNVKVVDIATLNIKPVTKRHGMKLYKTSAKKKAVVKLAEGNTITFFQNV